MDNMKNRWTCRTLIILVFNLCVAVKKQIEAKKSQIPQEKKEAKRRARKKIEIYGKNRKQWNNENLKTKKKKALQFMFWCRTYAWLMKTKLIDSVNLVDAINFLQLVVISETTWERKCIC